MRMIQRAQTLLRIIILISIGLVFKACVSEESAVINRLIPAEKDCSTDVQHGYTDRTSYLPGDSMKVFVHSRQMLGFCKLNVYTINREFAFSISAFIIIQSDTVSNRHEGFNYSVNAEVKIPDLPSGMYLIENKIPFIVKASRPVDVIVIYPSNTANAYSESGGKSLYSFPDRPHQVSFDRPIPVQSFSYECLQWFFDLPDFSVGFIADIDMDNYANVQACKVLVVIGHSEYWTRLARINFDKFIKDGGDGLILSGNTMWWQVRYSENSEKLICYKSILKDPITDLQLKTTTWSDPALNYPILPSIGADFDHGGYGRNTDNGWDGYKILKPNSPLLEGLNLNKGDVISLPTKEYDGIPIGRLIDEAQLLSPALERVISQDLLPCDKIEVVGYDKGMRGVETYGTFIVYKPPYRSSGYIINTASTDWCSSDGMGGSSGEIIKKITYNAVTKLVNNQPVFSR
jgi:hypothetical protein